MMGDAWGWHREAIQQRDQLRAENEALRKDAERYRWLRDKAIFVDMVAASYEEYDALVDGMARGDK